MNTHALRPARDGAQADAPKDAEATPEAIAGAIAAWLKSYLADLLDMDLEEIDVETSFDRLGLDSLVSVGTMSDLGDWLGCELDPAAPNDFPTIQSLARHLAGDDMVRAAYLRRLAHGTK